MVWPPNHHQMEAQADIVAAQVPQSYCFSCLPLHTWPCLCAPVNMASLSMVGCAWVPDTRVSSSHTKKPALLASKLASICKGPFPLMPTHLLVLQKYQWAEDVARWIPLLRELKATKQRCLVGHMLDSRMSHEKEVSFISWSVFSCYLF